MQLFKAKRYNFIPVRGLAMLLFPSPRPTVSHLLNQPAGSRSHSHTSLSSNH
uniref:Uncharacterized protein n=1 Tax=Arundo donax TaxID=35708 RepID=A0A0A8YDB4_ARUDO